MPQKFKTVYFADHPAADTSKRNLKLAFGPRDAAIFDNVAPLSSYDLRCLIGSHSYQAIRTAADELGIGLNTFCIRALREITRKHQEQENQLSLLTAERISVHGTFRSGKVAPFQRWYPWLEGYSPEFVRNILADFAPTANRILDPFGGCGTTPITAALLGKAAFFCELNPLLQFIVDAKVRTLTLPMRYRRKLVTELNSIAAGLSALIEQSKPDQSLRRSFKDCFGGSRFFSPNAFEDVLRARTLADEITVSSPEAGRLLTVAMLSSLIPSSKLQRAGDLRFRRGREVANIRAFTLETQERLRQISEDVGSNLQIDVAPVLVSEDARSLTTIPDLDCDAVITSPPYLNGTNYFRNTKVELWFLRSIQSQGDLASLRFAAVTAGINDVTKGKLHSQNPAVLEIVDRMRGSAYDDRIPHMVSSYFKDIEEILSAVRGQLRNGAFVAIDIGDSVYGGQRVPTDTLVANIARDLGYSLQQSILLRNRVSRDASLLKQVLLLFRFNAAKKRTNIVPMRWSASEWENFKKSTPYQRRPYSKRNWGHPFHSLCSYQGKLKPSIAHFLTKTFVPKNGRLLDPFGGVGTIPFEAALAGATTYMFDISPAALQIAAAKLGVATESEVAAVQREVASFLALERPSSEDYAEAAGIQFNGPLASYFHDQTFREILLVRRFFLLNPPETTAERLVFACMLHILHGNRPYSLSRRSHPITPFAPSGDFEYRGVTERLSEKVSRALGTPFTEGFVAGRVYDCDATSWWPQEVDNLDAIITSPPFFDSTRFYLANWMRLWFCGWRKSDFEKRPLRFVDERQKQSFRVYEAIFRQGRERLKSGGVFVMHLGKSRKCDMATEIAAVASPWFRVADLFAEDVQHCESHGIRDKGAVTSHQFLVLT